MSESASGPADVRDVPASYGVVSTEQVYDSGRVIAVRVDRVSLPDGGVATRDVVDHPGAVGVIALDDRDRVLLVQQYRHPVRQLLWEPPAGLLDVEGEDPLAAVKRELYEEAHHEADSWAVLVDMFTSPGMSAESVRVYLARGVREVVDRDRHNGVEEEADMPIAWLPLDEAVAKALAGELHNPMGIVGILAAARARDEGFGSLRPADAPWPQRPGTF